MVLRSNIRILEFVNPAILRTFATKLIFIVAINLVNRWVED